jgi:hypothetical protein
MNDKVNHPAHYTSHPSGVECIQITEHMGFCLGNAVKYIWRADLKADAIEDLRKARWYITREIERRLKAADRPLAPSGLRPAEPFERAGPSHDRSEPTSEGPSESPVAPSYSAQSVPPWELGLRRSAFLDPQFRPR